MYATNLVQTLQRAAKSSSGIKFYDDWERQTCSHLFYHELLEIARERANQIKCLPRARRLTVVLIHVASFRHNVEWFWAVVLAGLLPAVSTPLPADPTRRRVHITHLRDTLKDPIVLTSKDLVGDFEGIDGIDLNFVDDLASVQIPGATRSDEDEIRSKDPGALMLTSGSSGNAKIAILCHEQIIASVRGKSQHFGTTQADVFMNWIGFDHVASLIETHIHAIYLCADFVHVPATTIIAKPLIFLQLIETHRVTYTFAPHFFLARLLQSMEAGDPFSITLDLSCLRHLISGGESNLVETVTVLTRLLQRHNVRGEIVRPGFGMTETCAGSIYSKDCPTYDIRKGNSFASLGKPISGIKMRVIDQGHGAAPNDVGDLQLAGDLVFKEYFNDRTATEASFTKDGWFITGDRAFIDTDGNLNIAGREKESININGIKYFPNEIEMALESANIAGLTPSFTAVFSCRPPNSNAEELCVVYHPNFDINDMAKRFDTARSIVLNVGLFTSTRPRHILPLPRNLLHKSALGKLSRSKLKSSFEGGIYDHYEDSKDPFLIAFKATQLAHASTPMEHAILAILQEVVDVHEELGVNDSLFEFGITSAGLFVLKRRIEDFLGLRNVLAVGILLSSPTIRGICNELEKYGQDSPQEYTPVVPLQSNGNSMKMPLWLVHPGSGDVLVFVALAKYFPDRTVYGLRTRGLNTGLDDHNYFLDIADIADCYCESIKRHQVKGPYAIAGYSLGSTVAFEIGKRLEAAGEKVAFLGIFDSPPHMRRLIEKLDWIDVLLNVAYFLELIDEEFPPNIGKDLRQGSQDEALEFILACAPRERLEAFSIDKERLHKLTDVTDAFGQAGKRYHPSGIVQALDVFWVTPLQSVAGSRKEWMNDHLIQWNSFSADPPRFHECDGLHSKMLNSEYIDSFQITLKSAMAARGI